MSYNTSAVPRDGKFYKCVARTTPWHEEDIKITHDGLAKWDGKKYVNDKGQEVKGLIFRWWDAA